MSKHLRRKSTNDKIADNTKDLIVVVMAVEKWLLAEYHTSKHAAETPHVQRIVIHLLTQHMGYD